jgi:hypothetical protein
MANLIIQENGVARTTPAVHGEEITIQTPCDCSAVSGVQIAGVAYPFYDAAGKVLPTGTGLFTEGTLIRVLIDTVNTRSTIINHAITPPTIGAVKNSGDTMTGDFAIEKNFPRLFLKNTANNRHFDMNMGGDGYAAIYNRKDDNNLMALYVNAETGDVNTIFRISRKVGGVSTTYDILHTGNSNRSKLVADDSLPETDGEIFWRYK